MATNTVWARLALWTAITLGCPACSTPVSESADVPRHDDVDASGPTEVDTPQEIEVAEVVPDVDIECVSDFGCPSDDNPCTDDRCIDGACVHTYVDAACDDGNPCTEDDWCHDGMCVGSDLSDGHSCDDEADLDPRNWGDCLWHECRSGHCELVPAADGWICWKDGNRELEMNGKCVDGFCGPSSVPYSLLSLP